MPRDKWPLMSLQEHEAFSYDIMDMLVGELEFDSDCSLKDACREYGVSYDWVQMQAEKDPHWMDIVMMFEGLKKSPCETTLPEFRPYSEAFCFLSEESFRQA